MWEDVFCFYHGLSTLAFTQTTKRNEVYKCDHWKPIITCNYSIDNIAMHAKLAGEVFKKAHRWTGGHVSQFMSISMSDLPLICESCWHPIDLFWSISKTNQDISHGLPRLICVDLPVRRGWRRPWLLWMSWHRLAPSERTCGVWRLEQVALQPLAGNYI